MWIDSLFLICWKANHPFNDFGTLPFEQWYSAELFADGLKARGQILKWHTCSGTSLQQACWSSCLHLCAQRFVLHPCPALAPLQGSGATEGVGSHLPCSMVDFPRSQETSQICCVPVAVKSVLSRLQVPLLLAAAINLVEETSVMFESNFISSFIKQVSDECLSPREELCKRHGIFAPLLNWWRGNGKTETGRNSWYSKNV